MKHTKKTLGTMLLSVAFLTSCADMDPLGFNAFEKPASIEGMEYLADYDALKEYKSANSSVSPDFKLGMALSANDYNANGMWTRLANANFDEVVAGNEMKMASIVDDNGKMDFGTVSAFVTNAETNEMNIYGHTLAWHSQQPKKWLEKLIKDKELDIDPDKKIENVQYSQDWTTAGSYTMWGQFNSEITSGPVVDSNGLSLTTTGTVSAFWTVQYFIADGMTLKANQEYILRVEVKGSTAGSAHFVVGPWGTDLKTGSISFTTDWETTDIKFTPDADFEKVHAMLQSGDFAGTYTIRKVELISLETPAVEVEQEIYAQDWTKAGSYSMWGQFPAAVTSGPSVDSNGLTITTSGTTSGFWELQYMVGDGITVKGDTKYVMHVTLKGSPKNENLHYVIGAWGNDIKTGSISFDDNEKTVDISFTPAGDAQGVHILLQSGDYVGTYTVKNASVCEIVSMNTIPLTPEEKKDTLTWAMDQWIAGMMDACGGKVKAWDVVNEPISGGNPDEEGIFALHHADDACNDGKGHVADNEFVWQDYLGDLDYVRIAVAKAREYGPEDIKLFINDYNLESDWDNNQKLKSLIAWIKRWEADGVTKIDGIGTQMHLSYYSDPNVQASKEEHITEMFKLLAASGKLVRVSELDIEFKDEQGNNVKVEDMTDAQLRKVSDFYKWIIQQYIANVPAAQQYGFCIWTAVDADPSTSWTHNQLYGLWNKNFNRTHAYAGFADGLGGK